MFIIASSNCSLKLIKSFSLISYLQFRDIFSRLFKIPFNISFPLLSSFFSSLTASSAAFPFSSSLANCLAASFSSLAAFFLSASSFFSRFSRSFLSSVSSFATAAALFSKFSRSLATSVSLSLSTKVSGTPLVVIFFPSFVAEGSLSSGMRYST